MCCAAAATCAAAPERVHAPQCCRCCPAGRAKQAPIPLPSAARPVCCFRSTPVTGNQPYLALPLLHTYKLVSMPFKQLAAQLLQRGGAQQGWRAH